MIHPLDTLSLLPVFLYAETHYRFKYFFSFLRKSEPELISDAPHRIEPGNKIPILVLAKDSHEYPVVLHQVEVICLQEGRELARKRFLEEPCPLDKKWWWRVFEVSLAGRTGWVDIDVLMSFESLQGMKVVRNDNLKTSSRQPLRVYLSPTPLPRIANVHFGDTHTHSFYTDDQVEFGAPLEASMRLSHALGMSFFCTSDHSYDLDDREDNYLSNDPSIPKWKALNDEVSSLNGANRQFQILGGEEVTCRNKTGRNVHLLIFGTKRFFHGSGDSAERWFHTRSELSVREIVQVNAGEGILFAAHPSERVPFLQRLLLGRGNWNGEDLTEGLTGLQFINGRRDDGFTRGRELWVTALLRGHRLVAVAGNDAHGNFNRYRQVHVPFLHIGEHGHQIFGKFRTAVFSRHLSEGAILESIRKGNACCTDGPIGRITVKKAGTNGTEFPMGSRVSAGRVEVTVKVVSTKEFGELRDVTLYLGHVGDKKEEIIPHRNGTGTFRFEEQFAISIETESFIRMEARTAADTSYDGEPHFLLTNPIWISPP